MDWSIFFTDFNLTLLILAITVILFVQGKLPSSLIALSSLLAFLLLGILDTHETLAGFSSAIVLRMGGLFVVGAGVTRTGLARTIGSKILQMARGNANILFILVMVVTALIGAFVSNTGTVVIMMPILISIASSANLNIRRFLMPMAFASGMGIFTLISTPPNMVIQDVLINNDLEPLSFFAFAPLGYVAVLVGTVILFFSSRLLKEKNNNGSSSVFGKTLSELTEEYDLNHNLWKVEVSSTSQSIIGKSLAELKLSTNHEIIVGKIIHKRRIASLIKNEEQEIASPLSVVSAECTLYCHGSQNNVNRFAEQHSLIVSAISEIEIAKGIEQYALAEAIILPNSHLENKTLKESHFREFYNVSVAGIKTADLGLITDVKDKKLHTGDVLLISGKWDDIVSISEEQRGFVVVGRPEVEALKVTFDRKAPTAALILVGMIIVMTFNLIPSVAAVLFAAALMILTGCLKNMEEAYDNVNWSSIVLIGAMLPMSTAFEKTRITTFLSDWLSQEFASMGPFVMLAAIYCFTSLMSLFMSNIATAVLFAPIAMKAAIAMGVSPNPFSLACYSL